MDKERFEYLTNTLPWNLSKEDLQESNEIKDRLRPALYAEFFKRFGGVIDGFDSHPEGRDQAVAYQNRIDSLSLENYTSNQEAVKRVNDAND